MAYTTTISSSRPGQTASSFCFCFLRLCSFFLEDFLLAGMNYETAGVRMQQAHLCRIQKTSNRHEWNMCMKWGPNVDILELELPSYEALCKNAWCVDKNTFWWVSRGERYVYFLRIATLVSNLYPRVWSEGCQQCIHIQGLFTIITNVFYVTNKRATISSLCPTTALLIDLVLYFHTQIERISRIARRTLHMYTVTMNVITVSFNSRQSGGIRTKRMMSQRSTCITQLLV